MLPGVEQADARENLAAHPHGGSQCDAAALYGTNSLRRVDTHVQAGDGMHTTILMYQIA